MPHNENDIGLLVARQIWEATWYDQYYKRAPFKGTLAMDNLTAEERQIQLEWVAEEKNDER